MDALYRRFVVMVRNRALALTRNPAAAEDVTQEVFLKLLEHRRKGGTELETAAFLYRMTTNLCLNKLRNERTRSDLIWRNRGGESPTTQNIDDDLALRRALQVVPEEDATIAIYYYLDGMEQEEIAELLSMQRRTVGRRLERFREQARKALEREASK
jgi:RNA polymerase sigma-70 factor, ECF subfamily